MKIRTHASFAWEGFILRIPKASERKTLYTKQAPWGLIPVQERTNPADLPMYPPTDKQLHRCFTWFTCCSDIRDHTEESLTRNSLRYLWGWWVISASRCYLSRGSWSGLSADALLVWIALDWVESHIRSPWKRGTWGNLCKLSGCTLPVLLWWFSLQRWTMWNLGLDLFIVTTVAEELRP